MLTIKEQNGLNRIVDLSTKITTTTITLYILFHYYTLLKLWTDIVIGFQLFNYTNSIVASHSMDRQKTLDSLLIIYFCGFSFEFFFALVCTKQKKKKKKKSCDGHYPLREKGKHQNAKHQILEQVWRDEVGFVGSENQLSEDHDLTKP